MVFMVLLSSLRLISGADEITFVSPTTSRMQGRGNTLPVSTPAA